MTFRLPVPTTAPSFWEGRAATPGPVYQSHMGNLMHIWDCWPTVGWACPRTHCTLDLEGME